MIELEYYCPECDDFFIEKIDTNYRCKCGVLLYLDYFEDQHLCEGSCSILGCCNVVDYGTGK